MGDEIAGFGHSNNVGTPLLGERQSRCLLGVDSPISRAFRSAVRIIDFAIGERTAKAARLPIVKN